MDIAYIAGLFDGEGYVGVVQHPTHKRTYTLRCSITNTQPQPLLLLVDRFQGSILRSKGGWAGRGCYVWVLHGVNALEFLREIEPHVIIKRDEVRLALTFPLGAPGLGVSDEDLATKERICSQLKEMKRRPSKVDPVLTRKLVEEDPRAIQAAEMYAQGMSCREIAAQIGAKTPTVQYWVTHVGNMRSRSDAQTLAHAKAWAGFYAQPEIQRAIELYRSGLSAVEVARQVGRKPATVNAWLRKLGLTRSLSEAQRLRRERSS